MCYPYSIKNTTMINTISPHNIELNWIILGCVIVGQFFFALLCVLKPIQFWVKFGAIFGLLFPALTFRLVFLCPIGSRSSLPVAVSRDQFNLISLVYGLGVVVLGMIVGMRLQKRLLFWVFVVYWIFYMFAILFWRLFLQYHSPIWP